VFDKSFYGVGVNMGNAGYHIIMMIAGLFLMIASAADWNILLKFIQAKSDLKLTGRYIARIAYFILGFLIFGFGFLSITGLIAL